MFTHDFRKKVVQKKGTTPGQKEPFKNWAPNTYIEDYLQ
jgi:hypothetical protein